MELKSTTATCTEAGVETYYCYLCKEYEETKEVEAYGHKFNSSDDSKFIKESSGNVNLRCSNCAERYAAEVVFVDNFSSFAVENYSQKSNGETTAIGRYVIEKVTYEVVGTGIAIDVVIDPRGADTDDNAQFYLGYTASMMQENGVELSENYYVMQKFDLLAQNVLSAKKYDDGTVHFKFKVDRYMVTGEAPEFDFKAPVAFSIDFMSSVTVNSNNKIVACEN